LRPLLSPGSVAELRVLHTKRGTVSGYFSDFRKIVEAAGRVDVLEGELATFNRAARARDDLP
jgi:hypothetical protein